MPDITAREERAYPFEVRAPSGTAGPLVFEGYAARFDEWSGDLGGFRERIERGAFARSLETDDVRALFNHNPNYVLGRNKAGTLTLREDDNGLRFEIRAPDTGWARDLRESVRRGDINQCSFGFKAVDDEWSRDDRGETRTLRAVKLYDISIVTFPAYKATEASTRGRKAASEDNGQNNVPDANDVRKTVSVAGKICTAMRRRKLEQKWKETN